MCSDELKYAVMKGGFVVMNFEEKSDTYLKVDS